MFAIPAWTVWTIGGVLAAAGAALMAWALFWDRARGRRRCPRCWYDMRGVGGLRCPECGREAGSERRLTRTRRRWRWAIVGLVLALTFPALLTWRQVNARGWYSIVPTPALISALPLTDDPSPNYKDALYRAFDAGTLPVWQRRLLYRRCDTVLQGDYPISAKAWAIKSIECISWRGGYYGAPTREASEGVPVIVRALRGQDEQIRGYAAGVLGSVALGGGETRAVEALAAALAEDPSPDVRLRAMQSVGFLMSNRASGEPALPALIAALRSEHEYEPVHAASLLGRLGASNAERVVPALTAALESPSAGLRHAAAKALGEIGPGAAGAVPALTALLGTGDKGELWAAATALGAIGVSDDGVREGLFGLMTDGDAEARRSALTTLLVLGYGRPPTAARILAAIEPWRTTDVAAVAARAHQAGVDFGILTGRLVDGLRSGPEEYWETRFHALRLLCFLGYDDPAIAELVRPHLEDELGRVRVWATLLLAQVEGDRASAVPALMAVLGDASELHLRFYERQDAATALGLIGPDAAEALPLLERLLRDQDGSMVRKQVREAIRAITGREPAE